MKKIILFSAVALWMLIVCSCEQNNNEDVVYPNAKIIKELPILYGDYTKSGEIVLIQSQKELENRLNNSPELIKELDVDFEKYSLIMGTQTFNQGVAQLKHSFIHKQDNKYSYLLTVELNDATVVCTIVFGIVIDKTPNSSDIELEIINGNS